MPFVTNMHPATDLYWFCQSAVSELALTANLAEQFKSAAVRAVEEHSVKETTWNGHCIMKHVKHVQKL